MAHDAQSSNKPSCKDTLNLPQTDFPIRPEREKDDKIRAHAGQKALVTPGCDCHGLPIEINVSQEKGLPREEFIKACWAYC